MLPSYNLDMAAWQVSQTFVRSIEYARLPAIFALIGGWFSNEVLAWQTAHPILLCTDFANAAPSTCNESLSPFASFISSPFAEWQARHCWSSWERALSAARAVRLVTASTTTNASLAAMIRFAWNLVPVILSLLRQITTSDLHLFPYKD